MQTLSRDMVARCTGVGSILFAGCIAGLLPAVSFGADVENTASIAALTDVLAVSSEAFLSSLGVVTFLDQGADPNSYIAPLHYTGIRNIRDGVRNLSGSILLHEKIGVQVNLLGADVTNMIAAAKALATRDALLSLEGPNEPNNFPIQYNGKTGGGTGSWVPVAELQRDLYKAVKADPLLKRYPVFHVSEGGAEVDNVGLQFLKIPKGADTLFPEGTEYADYANPHNYVSGLGISYIDNQAWQAADPTLHTHWDGLYGEYGKTWKMGFQGYSEPELESLPRITSETGWDSVSSPGGERVQGTILVNVYLAQFKRGWRYTFIYHIRDSEGGAGNQGLFNANWTPKLSATYIHNLTSILSGGQQLPHPGHMKYQIINEAPTVHDLLLQKRDGVFDLVVWGEQVAGQQNITIDLGSRYKSVKIFDVTSGTKPLWDLTDVRSIPLVISDHAFIIEVS